MSETCGRLQPEICAERGHHGPFINMERYNAMAGWEGLADCRTCGTTCRVDSTPADSDPAPESCRAPTQ